ncbi:hypothetical protein EYF80_015399 [Liparis tanakae]|uniref:Uncharacterized protein n=1 Tax=Liparis tanakae TaxID=230148 RepID=A0A4Z2I984_9TELE|nr:hypothetical protein EYF80_015399 [Liparis tanakae]
MLPLRLKDFRLQHYESGTQELIGPSCETTASKLKYFNSGRRGALFPLTYHALRDSGAQAQGDGEEQRSHPLARNRSDFQGYGGVVEGRRKNTHTEQQPKVLLDWRVALGSVATCPLRSSPPVWKSAERRCRQLGWFPCRNK